jgi:NAD(P)-dependent dehydrogenase (short-subunit alcohol dehydrogenase family)
MWLDGKRVVITGAASGIGRDTARLFAQEGARLAIGDLNEEGGRAVAEEVGGTFVRTDVSRAADMEGLTSRAAEALGGIDVLVNNAGLQHSGAVTEFPEEKWDALFAVNAKSCFLGARYGVPHLRRAGGGVIVNTASLAGLKGGPGMTAYSASKGAVIAFTKALAAEVAPDGIRANAICPGWVDTPFNQPAIDFMGGTGEQDRVIKTIVPLQRQGQTDEIARAMLFLASDLSSYMTGQALVVDGGVY